MTMQEESGATPGSSDAGNDGAGEGSNAASSTDYFSGLDEGSQKWINDNGISKDDPKAMLSGVVTKSREMEKLIGGSLKVPGEDATPEDLQAFYDKATEKLVPADAAGYEYELPEGVPEDMPYDSDFADQFKAFSHEAKMPANVSKQTHDWFVKEMAGAVAAQREADTVAHTGAVKAATKALEAEWGGTDTDEHKAAQEHVARPSTVWAAMNS